MLHHDRVFVTYSCNYRIILLPYYVFTLAYILSHEFTSYVLLSTGPVLEFRTSENNSGIILNVLPSCYAHTHTHTHTHTHIYIYIYIYIYIQSFSILSDDRSKASSKTMPPHSAIQNLLLQMRISSPVLKVIQQLLTSSSSSSCHFHLPLYLSFDNLFQKAVST